MEQYQAPGQWDACLPVEMLYLSRMRSDEDRTALAQRFEDIFKRPLKVDCTPSLHVSSEVVQIGRSFVKRRNGAVTLERRPFIASLLKPIEHIIMVIVFLYSLLYLQQFLMFRYHSVSINNGRYYLQVQCQVGKALQ